MADENEMNLPRIYLIAILLLTFGVGVNGQQFDEESNWYKEIGKGDSPYARFDFSRYSKRDVENAKAKFLRISSITTDDEWSGTYTRQTMLGSSEMTWEQKVGFVYAYVYHTLANIDYGRVTADNDSVRFASERPIVGKRFFEVDHIKVKFGEKHLLVPKSRLTDFAIWAVGREVPTGRRAKEINTEEGFFWEKVEDEDKEIADVPTYPEEFAHLVRKPIQSKLLSVGQLRIKRKKSADWGTTSEDHLRTLTLSSGTRQGVRVGMRFWIDDLEEWAEIVSVTANRSHAELNRPFIEGREYCSKYEDRDATEFPCRNPRAGMGLRTRVEYF